MQCGLCFAARPGKQLAIMVGPKRHGWVSCGAARVEGSDESAGHASRPQGHDDDHPCDRSGRALGWRHQLEVEPGREDEDHRVVARPAHETHDAEKVCANCPDHQGHAAHGERSYRHLLCTVVGGPCVVVHDLAQRDVHGHSSEEQMDGHCDQAKGVKSR